MKLSKIVDLQSVFYKGIDLEILGVAQDSRKVTKGDVFFALEGGHENGQKFIQEAYTNGALLCVIKTGSKIGSDVLIPILEVPNVRQMLAKFSSKFYTPQVKNLVAVTGTSGKTSVVSFLRDLWTQNSYCAASIGTIGFCSPLGYEPSTLTTPDTVSLHKLLQKYARSGITHVAMEASSHGLDQYRLDGVQLEAAAFTNLGHDHMDYHKTQDAYLHSKLSLFDRVLAKGKPAVIFSDDPISNTVIDYVQNKGREVLTVGIKGSFIKLKRVEHLRFYQRIEFLFGETTYEIDLPFAGGFQVKNAFVALALALVTNVKIEDAIGYMETLKSIPGRLDLVGFTSKNSPVYVDYAHKPEALESVLKTVRPFTTKRVFLIFGCGGDRDKTKRSLMGEISNRLADVVIVTDDNPRTEDAAKIRSEILKHTPKAREISDRRLAIETAMSELQEGDTLIIAGKGHEQQQIFKNQTYFFSDHEEVKRILRMDT